MSSAVLRATDVGKGFNDRTVLRDVSFDISSGDVLAVVGRNGIGKSTLLRILGGLLKTDKGTVQHFDQAGVQLAESRLRNSIGFAAPSIRLYPMFTVRESVVMSAQLRGKKEPESQWVELANKIGLGERLDDYVGELSSGLQQRAKLLLATIHQPTFLFLDEPMTNLDRSGRQAVSGLVERGSNSGQIICIATNDQSDLALCTLRIDLSGT